MSKKIFLKGTLILACTGLISRIAGFFYRIFLSMPLVRKVLVCISWFFLSRDLWPLYPIQGSSLPFPD